MNPTKSQTLAAVRALVAVAELIRDLRQVPAGKLYATLMPVMDKPAFDGMIRTLVNTGLVHEDNNHLLTWIEPVVTETA